MEAYPQPEISRIISEDARGRRQLEVKGNSWTVNSMTESTHLYLTTFELRMPILTPQYFDRTYYLDIENTEGTKTLAFLLQERGTFEVCSCMCVSVCLCVCLSPQAHLLLIEMLHFMS